MALIEANLHQQGTIYLGRRRAGIRIQLNLQKSILTTFSTLEGYFKIYMANFSASGSACPVLKSSCYLFRNKDAFNMSRKMQWFHAPFQNQKNSHKGDVQFIRPRIHGLIHNRINKPDDAALLKCARFESRNQVQNFGSGLPKISSAKSIMVQKQSGTVFENDPAFCNCLP